MESANCRPRVAMVDDDGDVVASFINEFSDEFEIIGVTAPVEAVARTAEGVAVAVVDERMPRISGVEVLRRLRAERPEVTRILLTAFADFDRLAAAVNDANIFSFVAKPWRDAELRQILHEAARVCRLGVADRRLLERLQQERDQLASQKQFLLSHHARGFASLIGESEKLRAVIKQARQVVNPRISVLIEGESGTGKELLAQAIHYEGRRRDQLFVAINCAAIPETLLESELFGYEKGAFSGAVAQKKGQLEIAHGGTVFLDEIGLMLITLQAKLLRALQEHEFYRIGGTRPIKVDFRLIAATNCQLRAEVAAHRFREDLYYRVATFRLTMPPLRERPEDIPLLAQHFLARFSARDGKKVTTIADDALLALSRYRFPGNVRELAGQIERAVVLASGSQLELEHFSEEITAADLAPEELPGTEPKFKEAVREFKRQLINDTLVRTGGNRTHAARALGITYRGLLGLMRDLGLD